MNSFPKYKIAVDIRSLAHPLTGIGRYTFELLSRLIQSDYEWYLYSSGPPPPFCSGIIQAANVHLIQSNIKSRFGRFIWWHFFLPRLLGRNCINLFWSPAHRIPFFLSRRVKTMVTIHDLVWKHAPSTMKFSNWLLDSLLMPYSVMRADKVICISHSTKNDLLTLFPNIKNKVKIIYLGITVHNLVNTNQIIDLPKINSSYILFVGTFEPRKNIERLVRAFSLLEESLKDSTSLVLVGGNGWGNQNLKSLINNLKLNQRVINLGWVNDDHLAYLYKNALFVAMPSLYEGFGLPLIEAMQYGVPSLTSVTSSMPEIIEDAGELVNPHDVESIRGGLTRLLLNRQYLDDLGRKAFVRSKKFSWELATSETLEVIDMIREG